MAAHTAKPFKRMKTKVKTFRFDDSSPQVAAITELKRRVTKLEGELEEKELQLQK